MFTLAIRGVRAHPFRYVATAIAIILGIAFFTATSVLTTSFEESINSSIAESFTDIDAAVRSTATIDAEFFEIRQQISAATAEQVGQIDGVAAAEPYLSGYAQVVTAEGKTVDGTGSEAFAWVQDETLNPYTVTDGVAPTAPDEIVVDESTFADGGFAIGDEVRVLPLPADQPFTIVGTITADGDNDFGGQVLALSFGGAATVLGTTDVDQVFVRAEGGTTQEDLVAALTADLPDGLEAVSGDDLVAELQDLIGTFASVISTALSIFAGVSLFVGIFVIYNTFSIIVAQRTREMALLRAIGASGRQVATSVLVESLAIGVMASIAGALGGIGLGYGLLQLLGSVEDSLDIGLSVPPTALITGVVIGTIITVGSAAIPSRRAATVAPMEALRETAIEPSAVSVRRIVTGAALLAVGAAGAIAGVSGASALYLLLLPVLVISIFVLAPAAVRPFASAVTLPLVKTGSITGELARDNASRNPKRSATTSLTLMIGVAMVTTASIFAATLSASLEDELRDSILAAHVVVVGDAVVQQGGGLDPSVAGDIAAIDGVTAATGLRRTTAALDSGDGAGQDFIQVTGVDAALVDSVLDLGATAPLTGLDATSVAVSVDAGPAVGDTVTVRFAQESVDLTVVSTFEGNEQLVGEWVVDQEVLDTYLPRSLDVAVFVATAPGADVTAAIEDVLASDPTARVKSKDTYISDQAGQINSLLVLLYGLLGMSVIVALVGIVNTMALSIHERIRELGLLRAVGMSNRQLRRTVRAESIIVALMGTTLGLGLGLVFGWLVGQAAGEEFPTFQVPWSTMLIIAVIGVIAGIGAGILPARRATKVDILDAVASE